MTAKKILRDWLAEDDFKSVFRAFFFLADKYKDERLQSDITFQSGRFKSLQKHRENGTILQESIRIETAQIRQMLLQMVEDLPDDWTLDGMEHTPTSPAAAKINWKKYAAYFVAAITLLAAIAEFSGYSLKDCFTKKDTTEIPTQTQPPAPNVSTNGDNSPAVITNDGDVNINYGDTQPKKDSTNTTQKTQK